MSDDYLPTPDDVRGGVASFQDKDTFPDSLIENYIQTAADQAQNDNIPTDAPIFKSAVIYYARHLMYLDQFMAFGGVTSATTLGNSQTIADHSNYDPWLTEYDRIADKYGANSGDVSSNWYQS